MSRYAVYLHGDSESDIFEVFAEPLSTTNGQLHLIVRGAYDRALADGTANVLETVRRKHQFCTNRVSRFVNASLYKLPKVSQEKIARCTYGGCNVHATSVTINPGSGFEPVTLNAVLVEEPNPDNVDVPIQWLLLTPFQSIRLKTCNESFNTIANAGNRSLLQDIEIRLSYRREVFSKV